MSVNFKNNNAERTTVTRNTVDFEKDTANIYESIVAMSKRSNQISVEFASTTDNLEEIFENR